MKKWITDADKDPTDPMSNRLSDAMTKMNIENTRNSLGRPPPSPGAKRNSGLDATTINAMFPDAAAAIAQKKIEYAQQTGNAPPSNRNSAAFGDRNSLVTPTISAPADRKENMTAASNPWTRAEQQPPIARPKSSSGQQQQQPMGQFSQNQPPAGLKSPRTLGPSSTNIQNTTLSAPDHPELPVLSPYNPGSWASMTNTPMVPNFNTQAAPSQADMIANATAMKLAALSTVNNRIALDDVRKYRRARSNEPQPQSPLPSGLPSTGIPGTSMVVVNDAGQILNAQQLAALQQQQAAAMAGRRSRPNSPGIAIQGPGGIPQMGNFTSPNGFLSAYDGSSPMMQPGIGSLMGQFGAGHEGYLSDHSEMTRGRSPRGRRGSSKPPEDPTDPSLLQDIPAWLRSLRLHKYTDNLKDLKWTDLVELDDKGLEDRGVNALGARNKMLKVNLFLIAALPCPKLTFSQVFEQVKEARQTGKV